MHPLRLRKSICTVILSALIIAGLLTPSAAVFADSTDEEDTTVQTTEADECDEHEEELPEQTEVPDEASEELQVTEEDEDQIDSEVPDSEDEEDEEELFIESMEFPEVYGVFEPTYGGTYPIPGSGAGQLSDIEYKNYTILRNAAANIANGTDTSTVISFDTSRLDLGSGRWTAADLGVTELVSGGYISSEASDALHNMIVGDLNSVIARLLADCPYEMFWYDKTTGVRVSFSNIRSGTSNGQKYVSVGTVTYSFSVCSDYSNGAYTVSSTAVSRVQSAAANAQAIVDQNASLDDIDKLNAYRQAICDLTSYNNQAVSNSNTPYGDPWQMLYVFDGNTSTNVVCEGYSKAFKYLCDLSDFDTDDVECILASGYLGSGGHMWNIVLFDGVSYLVDITNCDSGTVGSPDLLFMKPPTSGSYDTRYEYTWRYSSATYTYDYDMYLIFTADRLTISMESQLHQHTVVNDPAVPATCTSTGLTAGSHCSVCGKVIVAQQETPMAAHTSVTDPAVPATCTTSGLTAGSHCSVCGTVITARQTVPANGHRSATIPGTPATCTQSGLTSGSYCTVCNTVLTSQQVIPATGHTPVTIPALAPTCTSAGHTAGSECSVCHTVITATTPVSALGHNEAADATVPATCTTPGHRGGSHCSRCGIQMTAQTVIPAAGHTPVTDPAVAATETSTGLTEGSHCSICDTVLVPQEVTPKITPTYAEGWVQNATGWWYRNSDGTYPKSEWKKISDKWYYFNASGYMVTGWQKINNSWYYLAPGGSMVTGWMKINNSWYYFDASGAMKTGWQKISNKWYYFNGSGVMLTGWQKINNTWYYFDGSGVMKTGWQKISDKWYYFNGSGAMLTGWQQISGKWYYFNTSGVMLSNTTVGSYRLGADGAMV